VIGAQPPLGPPDARLERLCGALRAGGHDVEAVALPPAPPDGEGLAQALAVRLLSLPNVERAISLAFPGHRLRHPDRVSWLLEPGSGAPRAAVRAHLAESRRLYAASAEAAARWSRALALEVAVLAEPSGAGASWELAAAELAR